MVQVPAMRLFYIEQYKARATDTNGVQMSLNEHKLSLCTGPPGNITNITAREGDTWISITWQPPSKLGVPAISGYQVSLEAMNTSQDSKTVVTTVDATISAVRISELLPMTTYVVSVMTLTNLTESVEAGDPTPSMSITTQPPRGKEE